MKIKPNDKRSQQADNKSNQSTKQAEAKKEGNSKIALTNSEKKSTESRASKRK